MNFRRSVIIAELWRPEVGRRRNFLKNLSFFGKTTPYGKIFKFCFESFYCLTGRHCGVEILWNWPTGNRRNRALCTWQKTKFACFFKTVVTAPIAPKMYQGPAPTVYPEFSRFHPNRFTFGGDTAERVNTAKWRLKVIPIFGRILTSSRIIKFRLP